MSDQELLHELTVTMRKLASEVHDLTIEMRRIQNEQLPDLMVSRGVHGEKISRLEMLAYGSLAAVALEGLGVVAAAITYVVFHTPA